MIRRRLVFFSIIGAAILIIAAVTVMRAAPKPVWMTMTATPKPALTAKPAGSDTPMPVPSPLKLDAQISPFSQAVSGSSLYFFGEITNTGDAPLYKPQVSIVLYDASDHALSNSRGFAVHDVVLPGQRVPISVFFHTVPAQWTRFEVFFKPQAAHSTQLQYYTDLSPSDIKFERDPLIGYSLSGLVKNTGARSVKYVQAVVTVYDAANYVVGTDQGFASPDALAPNESAPFKVLIHPTAAEPASYRVQFTAMISD